MLLASTVHCQERVLHHQGRCPKPRGHRMWPLGPSIVVAIAVVVTHTGDTRSGYLGAESGGPGTEMAHVSVIAAAVPWRKGRMGGREECCLHLAPDGLRLAPPQAQWAAPPRPTWLMHYRKAELYRVLNALPSAKSRALGKEALCRVPHSAKHDTRQRGSLPSAKHSAKSGPRQRPSLPSVRHSAKGDGGTHR